jgi:hypothetical protein
MAEVLDYASPATRPRSNWLARLALASLFYPIIVALCTYGGWSIAWITLGRQPIPSIDDPIHINRFLKVVHVITIIVLVGSVPAALTSFALTAMHVDINRASLRSLIVRFAWLILTWSGLWALSWWEPGNVLDWLLDYDEIILPRHTLAAQPFNDSSCLSQLSRIMPSNAVRNQHHAGIFGRSPASPL